MMPELPEVETVRRGLAPALEGKRIKSVDIRRADLRWPFPKKMAARLTGKRVIQLHRRSKYILADLDSDETLIIHLGMSGRMLVSQPVFDANEDDARRFLKHDHVIFDMESGARVTFNDPRRFGAMDLCKTEQTESHWLLAKLGPEPLGNAFDEPYLVERLRKRKSPIKTALLDQSVIAGLGNIYVCEVLHRTDIAPNRKANGLGRAEVARLVPAIRDVLQDAIRAGGASLQDHRQTSGELGYFQHSFRVYDKQDQPCSKLGCDGTITRIVQSGRSTFYCPVCQN